MSNVKNPSIIHNNDNDDDDRNLRSLLLEPGIHRGAMFSGLTLHFDIVQSAITKSRGVSSSPASAPPTKNSTEILRLEAAQRTARFAGASISSDSNDGALTHIIVHPSSDLKSIRKVLASRKGKIPRVVTLDWIEESWKEDTRIDEERHAPVAG